MINFYLHVLLIPITTFLLSPIHCTTKSFTSIHWFFDIRMPSRSSTFYCRLRLALSQQNTNQVSNTNLFLYICRRKALIKQQETLILYGAFPPTLCHFNSSLAIKFTSFVTLVFRLCTNGNREVIMMQYHNWDITVISTLDDSLQQFL